MAVEIPDFIRRIGIVEYMNAFLVENDVRPGMLLEPADYKERTEKDPKIKELIRNIRAKFPSLKPVLTGFRQVLFTKQTIRTADLQSNEAIGKAIGYPCADEYFAARTIQDTAPTTTMEIMVQLNKNVSSEQHIYQLIGNNCLSPAKQPAFEAIARSANVAIRADPVLSSLVASVFVRVSTNIPPVALMEKFVSGKAFTKEEMETFDNILFNLGFTEEGLLGYPFDFSNSIHRGVGMALLSLSLHNPLSPFYPLQVYPGKDTEVYQETLEMELELRKALDSARVVLEGGRRRRKGTMRRQ
jgi:hypothetical protein